MLLAVAALLAAPGDAAGQRPDTLRPRADTLRPPPADTGAAPADTLARDTVAARDTIPPPQLPRLPQGASPGFGAGIWVWDREALLLSAAVTVTELLERIPGMAPIRAGWYTQPEQVSALGNAGGRIDVVLDGFLLDPLAAAALDLSGVELAHLSSLRVERRLDAIRIHLETLSPSTPQAFARVDAGVAQPNSRLFRGIFMTPRFLFGPLAGAVERLDSDGYRRSEKGNTMSGWAKWSFIRGATGVQAELRRSTVERIERVPWLGKYDRTDWVVRGRTRLRDFVAEAYVGGTGVDHPVMRDSVTVADSTFERDSRQFGARIGYERPAFWATAALRFRDQEILPGAEQELAVGFRQAGIGEVDAAVRLAGWEGRSAASGRVRGQVGPFGGLSAFAELGGGVRGAPFLQDDAPEPIFLDRTGVRVGAELARGWLSAGGALVRTEADATAPFGLPFDRIRLAYGGGELTGWEGFARVEMPFWRDLVAEGWFSAWTQGELPLYAPDRSWYAALLYHGTPLRTTEDFEVLVRGELRSRGLLPVPAYDGSVLQVPSYTAANFYFQVRIMDVRLFFRGENFLGSPQEPVFDLPARLYPRARIFYGVKWQFVD